MPARRYSVRADDGGDDVAAGGTLVRVALATAHVVGGASRDRRHEHAAERFADLIGVSGVEQGDPLAADLVAAGNHRLGEAMHEAGAGGFIRQTVFEAEAC